jgi:outer membrane cobalamin receptor
MTPVMALLLLPLAFMAGPANASVGSLADLSLEDLMKVEVSTASKYGQAASDAPSAVTIITREDIRRFGWRDLADVLAAQRGFHVTDDRSYRYVGVRGIAPPGDYNARILCLINGMRLNDSTNDSMIVETSFPLGLEAVDRIEIVRGPGSIMYGGNALFAVVNIITRKGVGSTQADISAEVGSQQTRTLRATLGGQGESVNWLLSLSGMRSEGGQYAYPDVAPGRLSPAGSNAESAQRFWAQVQGQGQGEGQNWRVQVMHRDRSKNRAGGPFGTVFDTTLPSDRDEGSALELQGQHPLSESTVLEGRLFAASSRHLTTLLFDYSAFGGSPYTVNHVQAEGDWWGGEALLTSSAWAGHKWVAGVSLHRNARQFIKNSDVGGVVYDEKTTSNTRYGVFVQDEIRLGDKNTLMLGLRHDVFEEGQRFTSPRLAWVYRASDDHTLKLLYGSAFRTANVFERYFSRIGAPDLKPEGIKNLEAVWEGRLGAQTRATVSLYRYRLNELVALNLFQQKNVNSPPMDGQGGEFELEHRWSQGLQLRGSYSVQSLKQNSQRPDNAPLHLAQLQALLPLGLDGLNLALQWRSVGERKAALGQTTLPGYRVGDASLNWQPSGSAWDFSATVQNVANIRYSDPAPVDAWLFSQGILRDRVVQGERKVFFKVQARF